MLPPYIHISTLLSKDATATQNSVCGSSKHRKLMVSYLTSAAQCTNGTQKVPAAG